MGGLGLVFELFANFEIVRLPDLNTSDTKNETANEPKNTAEEKWTAIRQECFRYSISISSYYTFQWRNNKIVNPLY